MKAIRLLYASNVIYHRDDGPRQDLDFRMLVENRAFEKRVEVHWAGEDDHWSLLPAVFIGQASSQYEFWHAHAEFPASSDPDHRLPGDISFALRCSLAGRDHWDNNRGSNYEISADSGLRLADWIAALHTDYRPHLPTGQDFLPITIATNVPGTLRRVFVRWSTDRWRTSSDSGCYFLRRHWHTTIGSAARNPNRYGSQIWITQLGLHSAFRVEYAIAGETAAGLVWDNNLGRNYLVRRSPLRVLTLNLHCNQEENQDAKLSLIARAIRELEIDLVCFQEVAEPWNAGQGDWAVNTANVIRERVGQPYHLFSDWSHVGFGRYRESCAILSRFRFVHTDSTYISPGQDPTDIHSRRAVMAQVHVPYLGTVNVFSAHLSWWDAGFKDQFERLHQWIAAQTADGLSATLLCGDFNANTHSDGYAQMTRDHDFVDQFAVATPQAVYGTEAGPPPLGPLPVADPNRIDFVFLRRGDHLAAVGARELFTDTVYGRVSDHTGYLVEFEPK